MTLQKQDTMPWKAMHLAVRPQGTSKLDFPRLNDKEFRKVMSRLILSDRCTRQRIDGVWHYFATAEQMHAYKNPKLGKPPAPKFVPREKVLGKVNITYNPAKPRPLDAALRHFKAQDATYPVDANGRPLYKITVAPPLPQPTRTNTHSGAY